MLKKIFWLLPVILCLTSCATILAGKEYNVKLYSNTPDAKAKVNDSIYILPATVTVLRSNKELPVALITNSATINILLQPRVNPYFIYGNLPLGLLGYPIDLTNNKRFYYGREILLDDININNDSLQVREKIDYFKRDFPTHKGQINIIASIPYANGFYLQPHKESAKSSFGFLGFSIGAEYFYKDTQSLKFTAGSSIDFEFPFPVPLDHFDPYETASATNFTLTNNHKIGRFTLGYGLNYAIYKWRIINPDHTFPVYGPQSRTRNSHAYGLSFNAYHQFSKSVFLGVVYNPTFVNSFPVTQFKYQHTLSLDLQFKFTLHK
ncbi:hypothetical protein Q765_02670 [Flavobacterium rivuli WB 3.3-2 = DSM 21788]|uniref:Uncharacterized protein n=1 Tax=Flavobacterium rivuli WB 3.3-2 = DSM 21788 TaxID=1121895 RepID=A0A0A2M5P2_9FLAO|nr:hypothetical protein [Flavobacterium rivuli]KGO87987.1 hypothetical protein Q765_02670 [Flavobacterium rivuli WB 3.3-2 = DSM 21788]